MHAPELDVCFINTLPAAVGAQHAAPLLPEGYTLAQDLRNGHLVVYRLTDAAVRHDHFPGDGPGFIRLLGRVFDLDMATCPLCQRGSLCIIAAITHESMITRILHHLKLGSVPPPIAPARCRQELFAFD